MVTQLGAMPVTSSPGAGVAAVVAAVSSTSPAAAALPLGEQGQPSRRSAAENRRSNKPIMEKKRRARINNCLNELKTLILDAMKKDPARHSKLEKADILEMTVKHLETLQRQQAALIAATDPAVLNKFRAGFNECINEVGRFPGIETGVRRRLMQHLSCVNAHMGTGTTSATSGTSTPQQPLQVHILPATSTEPPAPPVPVSTVTTTAGIFLSNAGVPLVPTRLANGDLALVLPSSYRTTAVSPAPSSAGSSMSSSISISSSSSSPVPMLVPIPNRTPSRDSPPGAFERLQVNHSPISSPKPLSPSPVIMASPSPVIMATPTPVIMASPSSVPSPSMPMVIDDRAYSPPMPKPLSLVMRKTVCRPQDLHWRPW